LDILKDQWSPLLTLKIALISLQALLSSPEPDDPQDAMVGQQVVLNYIHIILVVIVPFCFLHFSWVVDMDVIPLFAFIAVP
jgi:hypothetical protein